MSTNRVSSTSGPFAIVAFIVGQAIEKFQPGADDALMQYNGTILDYSYTSTQIASAMCLQVGVIQVSDEMQVRLIGNKNAIGIENSYLCLY